MIKMEIKELQEKIYKFEKEILGSGLKDFKKEENVKKVEEIAKELIDLLEYNFIFRFEKFYSDGNIDIVGSFLKNKKRTIRKYEGQGFFWGEAYGIEALHMDKDFFMRYLKELFFPCFFDYQLEDSKKIIILTHDGDLKVKLK